MVKTAANDPLFSDMQQEQGNNGCYRVVLIKVDEEGIEFVLEFQEEINISHLTTVPGES